MTTTNPRPAPSVLQPDGRTGWRNTDMFAAVNAALFCFMCGTVYYDRFVTYRGAGNLHEFFFYAAAILTAIGLGAYFLRRLHWPTWLLIVVQAGIIAHFCGAFIPIDGGRLYDAHILGVRYDKYVHAFNAFAGASIVAHLLSRDNAHLPAKPAVILLTVLGGGAIVEILEYLVTLTVKHSGVGDYDNNMQDLISNLVGASAYVIYLDLRRRLYRWRHPKP
ncbi:MAG: hypothetical protein U1E50_15945 [Caulobacteraceae bacterium]